MKVAILTQPLGHNYGGLLQAYALQVYLKKIGCEVETLDRQRSVTFGGTAKHYVRNIIRLMIGRIKSLPTDKRQAYVFSDLTAFRDSKLTMSPTISSEKDLREYFCSKNFDAFIVGSDQVWRPRYSPSILNFYLDFLDDINCSAKRLAYAASFGVDGWEYTDEATKRCNVLAQRFDAISVREESAVTLCKEKLDVSAKRVVDPTLLLDPANYDVLINESDHDQYKGSVISYILDPEGNKSTIANKAAKALNLNIVSIKPELSIAQVRAKDLCKCKLLSIEKWLQAFRDASFVVTDSFHGTVFSILFNQPFIAIGNSVRGIARFESLLSQFGLINRLVERSDEVTTKLIKQKIDWDSVNKKRCILATGGQEFLRTHLLG